MSSQSTPNNKRPHDDDNDSDPNPKSKLLKSANLSSQTTLPKPIVFRVLCPANLTENVVRKEDNQIPGAKVSVEETLPASNDRVIVIENENEDINDVENPEPIDSGSVQKGLMLVFERMVEFSEDSNDKSKTFGVRLLVISGQVGPLLGKSGSVIKQMVAETGAEIRVLPRDKLPAFVSSDDELVQISGEVDAVRKAVQSVSQHLIDHPTRDNDSVSANVNPSHGGAGGGVLPAGPPDVGSGTFGGRFGPFSDMLTYRLICPDEKVGGVIGKGGTIVKALKHETGCDIRVLEKMVESDDRVIVISGPAHPDERICAPQDAVLRVQTRIFRAAPESKAVSAKVIVSAHQIGCILGKGGAVISEMRKSTGAYIRILGKDQTPQYAVENEEVVQVNGDYDAVHEALLQITTCLRNHYFRDAFPGFQDHGPPFPPFMGRRELSPPGRYPSFNRFDGGPPPHGGFHPHDDRPPFMHDRPDFPHPMSERLPSSAPWGPQRIEGGPGFPEFLGAPQRRMGGFGVGNHQAIITNTTVEVVVPRNVVPSIYGEDGGCLKQIREISDAKVNITDPKPGAKETLIIISGTPEQAHAAQSLIQAFVICETEGS